MKRTLARFLSLCLACMMVLCALPVQAEAEATAITLSPSYVEIWVNFGTECKLDAAVTGASPTQPLVYTSTNERVVTVSSDGNLTPVGEGTALVYATATDGTGAVSNSVTVHVLPDQAPPKDQKITLGSTSTPRINVADHLAWPKGGYGSANIALWKDNAKGTVTLTVDDSIVGNFGDWTELYRKYGVPVTFYVPTGGGRTNQATWEAMLELGHAVQSHTLTHPSSGEYQNDMTSAEEWMDFYLSVKDINELPTVSRTVAYSYGYNAPALTSKIFIAGRGTTGSANTAATINYNALGSFSGTSEDKYKGQIDQLWTNPSAKYYAGWVSYHFHQITPGALYDGFLGYLAERRESGDVWPAFFSDAAQYGQERDTATLTVNSVSGNVITFDLTDEMNDTLFTYPLTVKIRVDESWKYACAYQGGVWRAAKVVTNEEGTFLMVDAVPDRGEVIVSRAFEAQTEPEKEINYGSTNGLGDYTMAQVYHGVEIPRAGDTVTISSEEEWALFADYVNAGNDCSGLKIVLTCSLDLTRLPHFKPVGRETSVGATVMYPFKGSFDGCGYTITYTALRDGHYSGLFAYLSGAVVENLHVNATLTGSVYVGGIAGGMTASTVRNCTVSGSVEGKVASIATSKNGSCGGIAGIVGGKSVLDGCINYATVTAVGDDVGGIAGNFSNSTIYNCASFGAVSGRSYVGALVGRLGTNSSTSTPDMYNCLAAGSVSGSDYVGGICGYIGVLYAACTKNVLCTATVTTTEEAPAYVGSIFGQITRNGYQTPTATPVYYLALANEGMQTATVTHFSEEKKVTFNPTAVTKEELASTAFLATLNANAEAQTQVSCNEWAPVTVGQQTLPCPAAVKASTEQGHRTPPLAPKAPIGKAEFAEATHALSGKTLLEKMALLQGAAEALFYMDHTDAAVQTLVDAYYVSLAEVYGAIEKVNATQQDLFDASTAFWALSK